MVKTLNEIGIMIKESKDINIREISLIQPSEILSDEWYMEVGIALLSFLARDDFHERIILDVDFEYFNNLLGYLTTLDPLDRFVKYMELKNLNKENKRSM